MSATAISAMRRAPLMVWHRVARIWPLALAIILHLGFLYALQTGMLRQAVQALPPEIFATFITPDSPPPPTPQQPLAAPTPKTMPIVKRSVAPQPAPIINPIPSPQAITAEQPVPTAAPAQAAAAAVAAPPAIASAPPQPKTISSGVEYLLAPQPQYPPLSRRLGEEGRLTLRVLVNDKGYPEQVDVQKSSGAARLDEAGRQAILQARFRPHIDNGLAVAVYVIVPINFQLTN